MGKRKRTALDDLGTRLRELLGDLERLLNPGEPRRVPAPVPVPVRPPRPSKKSA